MVTCEFLQSNLAPQSPHFVSSTTFASSIFPPIPSRSEITLYNTISTNPLAPRSPLQDTTRPLTVAVICWSKIASPVIWTRPMYLRTGVRAGLRSL